MFAVKYPILDKTINNLNDSKILIDKINMITENTCNILFINDYEITCKISQYYLNDETPLARNSNTICIRSNYASYLYYITIYLLISSNNIQYYTPGEFMITSDKIIELIEELSMLIDNIINHNNFNDPLPEIKIIFTKLLSKTLDESEYNYLYNLLDNNISNNLSTFRDKKTDRNNNRGLNNNLIDDSLYDELISDSENSNELINSDDFINNIKENLVNTLGNY
jgi:hypothetical protein